MGSSMSRKRFSREKSIASSSLDCSPPDSVENGRYSASSDISSGASSRRNRHGGTSGQMRASSSMGDCAASGTFVRP